jgi:GNAT superfamily N-acetyltransferase
VSPGPTTGGDGAAELLAAFDRQVRQSLVPPQTGWVAERVGGVVRVTSTPDADHGCFVEWSDLDEGTADAEIAAQVGYYGGLGRRFEWKTYGYDRPADLPSRLLRAGFVAEEVESLVIGRVDAVTTACASAPDPTGIVIRELTADTPRAEWDGIQRLHATVWGASSRDWAAELVAEVVDEPRLISVLVAESAGETVCAGWVRFHEGTEFASLWGGSTLPQWRRRGIYRALVGRRAALAAERGYAYLQVDASADSRPILEHLGLRVLTTTTPYVWTPPA